MTSLPSVYEINMNDGLNKKNNYFYLLWFIQGQILLPLTRFVPDLLTPLKVALLLMYVFNSSLCDVYYSLLTFQKWFWNFEILSSGVIFFPIHPGSYDLQVAFATFIGSESLCNSVSQMSLWLYGCM